MLRNRALPVRSRCPRWYHTVCVYRVNGYRGPVYALRQYQQVKCYGVPYCRHFLTKHIFDLVIRCSTVKVLCREADGQLSH